MNFENETPRKGYVTPEVFHRFMNEVVGLKIGKNAVYEQCQSGKIHSLKTGLRGFQIPVSELEGAYEARLLQESQGLPLDPGGLLGKPKSKNTVNG